MQGKETSPLSPGKLSALDDFLKAQGGLPGCRHQGSSHLADLAGLQGEQHFPQQAGRTRARYCWPSSATLKPCGDYRRIGGGVSTATSSSRGARQHSATAKQ